MIKKVETLFTDLLALTEVRKVDYKRDQYHLDNETLKSKFVKDILCMANASGDDGYILLGVESEKGRPRKVIGVSHHYDSSNLEAIVNSVVDTPIQFEYYPLNYKGKECALLYIPKSKAKPHWPKRNYGKLLKHIIYTRRSSGNREASIQEIREMYVETMQLSDIAHRKTRVSPHIIDELKNMSVDDRKVAMYKMLKNVVPKVGLVKYRSIIRVSQYNPEQVCALASSTGKLTINYIFLIYPWIAKRENIIWAHSNIRGAISGSMKTNPRILSRANLEDSTLVNISYKEIYTRALESQNYHHIRGLFGFSNAWKEPWGRVIRWETDIPSVHLEMVRGDKKFRTSYRKKALYEFFVPNVASKAELQDRLEKLLVWINSNII